MTDAEVKAKCLDVLGQEHTAFILSTVDAAGRPRSRYMGGLVPAEGEEFAFYTATYSQSRKVRELARTPAAQVLVARPDWSEIVTLSGAARLVTDPAVKNVCWRKMPDAHEYFEGQDDPDFAVLYFKGEELEYLNMNVQREPRIIRL